MGSNPKILRQNPPWGPDRVWGDHCSSIPRVQQKHPISRLLSGHAGDFSPFRHPDWGLGRCSFRPSPRKATAPSPPDADTFLRFLVHCGQQTGPALPSLFAGKKKGARNPPLAAVTRSSARRRTDTRPVPSVVVTAAAQRANKRHHPTSNTSCALALHSFIRFATESLSHLLPPRFDGQLPAAWADAVASFTSKGVRGRPSRCPLPFRQRIPTALQPPPFASRSLPLSISPPSSQPSAKRLLRRLSRQDSIT